MRKVWTTERKIVGGFGLALLILCAVALISVSLTYKLLSALDAVSDQVQTLKIITDANTILPQMATSARLYAAKKAEAAVQTDAKLKAQASAEAETDFQDWEKATSEFEAKLDEIDARPNDTAPQRQKMAEIKQLMDEKIHATRRDSSPEAVENSWGLVNGKSTVRPIGEKLTAMSTEERNVLEDRNKFDAKPAAQAALWTIGIASVFAVMLVGFAATLILRDLKKRQAAALELERARQAAEAASVAKSAFLANMSHELRTPLTSIMGYADLLLEPQVSASRRQEFLQTLRRSGEHLLILINDILDVSKIEAGRMTVERVDSPLADILGDLDSLMRSRALDKGLAFSVQFMTAIPERVITDPTRLRQIVMNLVGNAVKFTDEGSVCVRVRFAGPGLVVEVEDTGVGISTEQQAQLFQPFVQADLSTTRRFGGTGLGLSISRRLAHMLGGELTLKSTPDVGSTFTLSLPMDLVAGCAMAGPGLARRRVSGTAGVLPQRNLGIRILLAEDGAENRDVIVHHLRHAGCEVAVAEDGHQAYEMALRAWRLGDAYDVILMDMQMPVMDGYTATSKLRGEGYAGPIIAITAHAMTEDRERCLRAGCDNYAAKPVDMPVLLGMLAALAGTAPLPAAGKAALRALTRKFCDSLPASLEALRDLCRRGDWDAVAMQAHRLAGAGGAYGFAAITDAAKALERAARAGPTAARAEPDAAHAWMDAVTGLQHACDSARHQLEPAASPH